MRAKIAAKRALLSFLIISLLLGIVPTVEAASWKGSDFTTGTLAGRLDTIISQGISSGVSPSFPSVGGNFSSSRVYQVKFPDRSSSWSGYQCIAYAYAAYNYLFNQDPMPDRYRFSSLTGKNSLSYDTLNSLGVRFGAYLRTTVSSSGDYNAAKGHSLLILSYNQSEITILEGVSIGNSTYTVRIKAQSWSDFNKSNLSGQGRYVCQLAQPKDTVYSQMGSGTQQSITGTQQSTTSSPTYADCNVEIACVNGQTVNLYNNPGDSSRVTYFNKGQIARSTYLAKMSDGTTWYRITAQHNGSDRTFWLKYESSKMKVTPVSTSYTVTLNSMGGNVSTSSIKVTNGSTYGSLPTPTRSGYTFDGWYTAQSGGSKITGSTSVNLTGNQTLYAHWTVDTINYTITFDATGGSVSPSSKTYTAGSLIGTLPTPTRSGYTFRYWSTAYMSSGMVVSPDNYIVTGNATLYAVWSANPQNTTTQENNKSGSTQNETQSGPSVSNSENNNESNSTPKGETWGPWSEWSSTWVSSSPTRRVESREVEVTPAHTEYRYARYVDSTGTHDCWCAKYLEGLSYISGKASLQYSEWTTTLYGTSGKSWTCGNCNGTHIGVDHKTSDGRSWWPEYILPSGSYYWYETRQVAGTYERQYRYSDLISG